jgi:tetratricopeptide (TPR) repeat protein
MLAAADDPATAVRAAFSWSYRALPPLAARMFRLLGLHPGPDISLPIAAAMADVNQDDAGRLLSALTSVHLLEETRSGRYRFHDLLSAYARECALTDETQTSRDQAERRALDCYLHTADAADRLLMPRRRHIPLDPAAPTCHRVELATASAAIGWCENERVNLVAATRHAAETGDHTTAWKLPVALWSYFAIRKRWTDWITTHQVAIAAARSSGDRYGEAISCASLAHAYRDLRRFDEASCHFERALRICREIGEHWVEAAALNLLAIARRDLGRFDDALACSDDALRLFEQTEDPWGRGWTFYNLVEIYTDMRHFDTAIHCSREALATFKQIDDQWGASWTLVVLGQACRSMGRPHEAIDYSSRALHVARQIGNQQGESLALYNLGKALFDTGRAEAARQAWQQALATFEELGAPQANSVRQRLHDLDLTSGSPQSTPRGNGG